MPRHKLDQNPKHPHDLERWQPPLPTDRDFELLEELLDTPDQARSVYRILQNCPPEVAAVGCLVLRVFDRIQAQESKNQVGG